MMRKKKRGGKRDKEMKKEGNDKSSRKYIEENLKSKWEPSDKKQKEDEVEERVKKKSK